VPEADLGWGPVGPGLPPIQDFPPNPPNPRTRKKVIVKARLDNSE